MKKILLALLMCSFFWLNQSIAQGETSSTDTLDVADIFGSQEIRISDPLPLIDGVGKKSNLIAQQKSLRSYLIKKKSTSDGASAYLLAISKCLEFYQLVSDDQLETGSLPTYLSVFDAIDHKDIKQMRTIQALTLGNPVIVDIRLDADFQQLSADFTWTPANDPTTTIRLPVLVIGFDQEKRSFEVLHPGSASGSDYSVWIRFSDFAERGIAGRVMRMGE